VVSRTPEDKVLAAVLVAPAAMGLLIDLLRSPGVGATLAAMIATGVLSVTHPLAAGLNAFVLTPFLLLTAWVRERPLLPAGIALAVVAAGLVYPIRTGGEARELLRAQGATLAEPNHPVVRVHLDRDRMMDLGPPGPSGDGRYVVAPRLLAHPLLVAGILSLAFAYRRPREERRFLLLATLLPLAFAFLPRLAMTLGSLVLPWMVYRVLWAVPFALLLATALGFAWSRSPRQGWIAVALLVALSIPGAIASAVGRAAPERAARNTPDPATLGPVLTALANLPGTTVVAAPPLLAERIPALTGKSVLALSDRATFVFAGTRDLAEERLRSRAAIYAGLWKPALEVPVPTHLLFAPGSPAERYCESVIASTSSVSLCTFDRVPPRPGIRMPRAAAPVAGVAEGLREMLGEEAAVLRASCTPAPQVSTNAFVWRPRGPWDPTAAAAVCTFSTRESQSVRLAGLLVRTAAGTPPGEIAISVRALRADAQRWNIRTRERAGADEALWFTLPKSELDTVEITIAGSFLPHLTLADLRVVRIAGAHAGGPP
jgi:hypothetical protein